VFTRDWRAALADASSSSLVGDGGTVLIGDVDDVDDCGGGGTRGTAILGPGEIIGKGLESLLRGGDLNGDPESGILKADVRLDSDSGGVIVKEGGLKLENAVGVEVLVGGASGFLGVAKGVENAGGREGVVFGGIRLGVEIQSEGEEKLKADVD
jgi:hypothetical protein